MAGSPHYLPSRIDPRDRAKVAGERGVPVYGRRPLVTPSAQDRADQAKIAGERGVPVYGRRPLVTPSAQDRADQAKIAGERGLPYALQSGSDYLSRLNNALDAPTPSPGTLPTASPPGTSTAPGTAAPQYGTDQYQSDQQALIDGQLNDALSAIGSQFSTLLADLERQRTEGQGQIDQARSTAVDAIGGINQTAVDRQATNVADQQAYAAQGSQMLGADANNIMAALQASGVDTTQLQSRLAEQQGFAQQQSTIQGDLLANLGGVAATGRDQNAALLELIQQGASGDLANNAAMMQARLAVQQSQQEASARQQSTNASLSLNQEANQQRLSDSRSAAKAASRASSRASSASSKAAKAERMMAAMIATGMSPTEAQLRVDSNTVDNWLNDLGTAQRDVVKADLKASEDAAVKAEKAQAQSDKVDYAVNVWGVDPTVAASAARAGQLDVVIREQMKNGAEPDWSTHYSQNPDAARADADPNSGVTGEQLLQATLAADAADTADATRASATAQQQGFSDRQYAQQLAEQTAHDMLFPSNGSTRWWDTVGTPATASQPAGKWPYVTRKTATKPRSKGGQTRARRR